MRALVEAGADVNRAEAQHGCTPVYVSSVMGKMDVLKALIKGGADLDKPETQHGRTPLYTAVVKGNVDVVKVRAGRTVRDRMQ